jgi:O-antigen/teichoic acid export membrane protein
VAVTAVLNVVMNLLLIPLYGIAGAAIAMAVTLAILKILLYRRTVLRTGIDSLVIRFVQWGDSHERP